MYFFIGIIPFARERAKRANDRIENNARVGTFLIRLGLILWAFYLYFVEMV